MNPADTLSDRTRWQGVTDWSRESQLSDMQTLMWRSESHPSLSSTTTLLIELDRAPDWARFVAAHEWAVQLLRRLRQRVVDPALPTAAPVWADDPTFDLSYHLRREHAFTGEEALDIAANHALHPFDRNRPLWEGVLIEGLPDGAAYVLKIHHALADPHGAVQLVSMMQSRTRRHTARKPIAEEEPQTATPDPLGLAVAGVRSDLAAIPERTATTLSAAAQLATRPVAALTSSLHYAASIRRLVVGPARPSPLLARRTGTSWRFLTFDMSLAALRSVAATAGGTLDDVAVALVLGGLARYHRCLDSTVDAVPIGVRVSLDRADDLGNRFASALIAGSLDIEDPIDRVAAVRGEVLSLHTERALEVLGAVAPTVNRMPSWLGASVLRAGVAADAVVVTLPGPPQRQFMAGAEVRGLNVLGPLPGSALTACLVTCADSACLGINVDASAVPEIALFEECLGEAIEEMLAAGQRSD